MIGYDFGMHRAGVLLHLLLLLLAMLVPPMAGLDGSAVRSPCESPTAQVRSRLRLKCVFAFRLVVGQAPRPASGENGNRQRLPYKQHAIATALRDENRRSVSEKALLQNQFSERKCAGWSGVE